MSLILTQSMRMVEKGLVPDSVIRAMIRSLCRRRLMEEGRFNTEFSASRYMAVLKNLKESPIAIETAKANEQHYELPTDFFVKTLGKRLKYSACYFSDADTTLDEAEEASLKLYCERAELQDGMTILELGCGWGSMTLWMAEHYPDARITGVSNSSTQREYITAKAAELGLTNIQILTQDVNTLEFDAALFDRVVSVEMFEHVRNYEKLFANISRWLKDDGKLWCHIFCHRFLHYPFEIKSDYDWMSQYFFTGGLMPAASTFLHFQDHLQIQNHWQWSGVHYEKTSNAWLNNMDANADILKPVFEKTYGSDAECWWQRWRIFFMACAELFGLDDGQEWIVGHYLMNKTYRNNAS